MPAQFPVARPLNIVSHVMATGAVLVVMVWPQPLF